MSIVGIDVGSSAVKVAAYRPTGELLALVHETLKPTHSAPGYWEQDVDQVWLAVVRCMRRLLEAAEVRASPPKVMAISASGREVFPVDETGRALGPCLMGADLRGAEFEALPPNATFPEPWTLACGHNRERMDPIFRLLWWQKNHPRVVERARWILGWHEFLVLRLTGYAITEHSLASRWLIYDLNKRTWSDERLHEYAVNAEQLPVIGEWGALVGPVRASLAHEWGLPHDLQIAVGGHDTNCAALGTGVAQPGLACLVSGTHENILAPAPRLPTVSMLRKGLSVMPHPGRAKLSTLAVSPTGNAVMNWARELTSASIESTDQQLAQLNGLPSPVLAVPYLSGAMLHWEDGRRARGALLGLTLATRPADIMQAFMESIAYDHVHTLALLAEEEIPVKLIRATGGGARSAWWTQLKSDLTGIPIEVTGQAEPGTFGAALLAGLASGEYDDIDLASQILVGASRRYEPNLARALLHAENIDRYGATVSNLLRTVF